MISEDKRGGYKTKSSIRATVSRIKEVRVLVDFCWTEIKCISENYSAPGERFSALASYLFERFQFFSSKKNSKMEKFSKVSVGVCKCNNTPRKTVQTKKC